LHRCVAQKVAKSLFSAILRFRDLFPDGETMARVTVEDCLEKIPNRLELIILAAKRTRQLLDKAHPLIPNTRDNKEPIIALREIAAGKVVMKQVEPKPKRPHFRRRRIGKYVGSQN